MAAKTYLKSALTIVVLFLLTAFAGTAQAKIIYVDDDAAGANDGSTWHNAYNYLQDALAVANDSDEIRVAQGIYKPDQGAGITPGNRKATFQLINDVTLKGGYAGAGFPEPDARDINGYQTILSGDLAGNDKEMNDPCDLLDDPTRAENSYHVVTGSGTEVTAVLDGFTITGGYAYYMWPDHEEFGGGMYNEMGNPTVLNCTFQANAAYVGGGMHNNESSPILNNCSFNGNLAQWSGGMANLSSSPTLTNCTFTGNDNCGMENRSSSNTTLINCAFVGNIRGIYNHRSSPTLKNCDFIDNIIRGMHNFYSSPTLTNCTFIGNNEGGMTSLRGKLRLSNCTFKGNSAWKGGGCYSLGSTSILYNCIFIGNSAEYDGGGLYTQVFTGPEGMEISDDWDLTMANCTFVGNSALYGNALASDSFNHQFPGNIQIANCILWNGGNEISNRDNSTFEVTYSDVWNGFPGEGNIDAYPCFVGLGYWDVNGVWIDDGYHLLPDSPCIDTGDPNYIAEPNETDLDGKPRIIGCRVDMGAYEYGQLVSAEARFAPRTINLASKGNWITCYIWLPEEYDVADIDPNSIFLMCEIEPEQFIIDEQQQLATAVFNREDVQAILEVGDINLKITGQLTDTTYFEATDTIKVIEKAGKN